MCDIMRSSKIKEMLLHKIKSATVESYINSSSPFGICEIDRIIGVPSFFLDFFKEIYFEDVKVLKGKDARIVYNALKKKVKHLSEAIRQEKKGLAVYF